VLVAAAVLVLVAAVQRPSCSSACIGGGRQHAKIGRQKRHSK